MKKIITFMLMLVLVLTIKAANNPIKPDQGCVSFDTKEETFYYNGEDKDLSLTEQMRYRSSTILCHVEKCEGKIETTILNPKEVFEPWMPQNVKTIVDREGLKYFNEQGELLRSYSKEELSIEDEDLGNSDEVYFELNEEIHKAAEQNGAKVFKTEIGYTMRGENFILVVNSQDKTTRLSFLQEGIEISSEKVYYTQNKEQFLPSFKTIKSTEKQPNGDKIEKVTVITYSNYQTI